MKCTKSLHAQLLSHLFFVFASIVFLNALGNETFAQTTTANISGTVTDAQGAAIAGAQVTARQLQTGFTRDAQTNETGQYALPLLPIGAYELSVSKTGFASKTLKNVVLQVDDRVRLNVSLDVGAVAAEVTVDSGELLLKRESGEIAEVIDNKRVVDLPLNGRQFLQLATLTPGVTVDARGSITDALGDATGPRITVNGLRQISNNFTIDGVRAYDRAYNTLNISPSIDAIQEFKVQAGTYAAEFGEAIGAQVNIAIKSGTNDFHGTLYEFLRNDAFDARNFFDGPDLPPFRQNQFGGTIGGPIVKNKLFFFGNYEGLRIRKGLSVLASVPSNALRNGDLSSFSGPILSPYLLDANGNPILDANRRPQINRTSPLQPFRNNQIPASLINPIARAYLAFYPQENNPGNLLNYIGNPKRNQDQDQFTTRIDFNISRTDTIFGRFTHARNNSFDPYAVQILGAPTPQIPGFGLSNKFNADNLAINYSHIFSPALIGQIRFGLNRLDGGQIIENLGNDFASRFGIQGLSLTGNTSGIPRLTGLPFPELGDSPTPVSRTSNDFEVAPSVTYTRGNHTFKVGSLIRRLYFDSLFDLYSRGQYYFGTFRYTGNTFADFLLGIPSFSLSTQGDLNRRYLAGAYQFYVQDDWKVTPNLTLNLGLRYDYFGKPAERDRRAANFIFDTVNPRYVIADDANPADFIPGIQNFLAGVPVVRASESGLKLNKNSLFKDDLNNFGPRFGFAYTPFKSGKTVIRGGAGIFYEPITLNIFGGTNLTPPFAASGTSFNLGGTAPFNPGFNLPATTFENLANPRTNFLVFPVQYDFKDAESYQFSLSIQQEIFRDTVLETYFSRTSGRFLNTNAALNTPLPGSGNVNARRPIVRNVGSLPTQLSVAKSNYNGLVVKLERRFVNGFTASGSYTFSKSLDTDSSGQNSSASGPNQDPYNLEAEYGRSSFDVRHRIVANFGLELPFGRGRRFLNNIEGAPAKLVEGWQLQGIYNFNTGLPFTVQTSRDLANTGRTPFQRPDVIRDPNLPSDERTAERWFDTGAFSTNYGNGLPVPGNFRYGNLGRNTLFGPHVNTFDFSIIKDTRITERVRFEFRTEIFNLFNTTNFAIPDRVLESRTFGRIFQTAIDSRQLQFGAKLIF